MKHVLGLLSALLFVPLANAEKTYENRLFSPDLRSLQVTLEGDAMSDPIIHMGGDDHVVVCFDQMSHRPHFYSYRVIHCDADWKKSNISEIDYMKGFSNNKLESDYQSLNTTFDYTHYSLTLPNDDVEFTASGNYVVVISDEENVDSVLATACFMISEDAVSITGHVTSSTPYGVNNCYQLLNYNVDFGDLNVFDAERCVKTLVTQNGRVDNMVFNAKPTSFINNNQISYDNERKLVFEGGTEYDRVDFSHMRNYNGQIDRILYAKPYYHVDLATKSEPQRNEYRYDQDVDGRFKFHAQDVWSEKEIDYSIVHFSYKKEEPWLDGNVYVLGYFNDNRLDAYSKMTYNYERKQYELATTLKNGGYNYQYVFLPAGSSVATSLRTIGSYWQTENTYTIYVYFRPLGEQYDRLVGVQYIRSGNK